MEFPLFFLLVSAVAYGGAALTMLIAYGLFAMTGLHEFAAITTLWLFYKCGETYINWEGV